MSHDPYDDEDWYDDTDEPDGEEVGRCPECGEPVHDISDKCPACGYWLSDSDRHPIWSSEAKPAWLKIAAVILLLAFVAGTLAACGIF